MPCTAQPLPLHVPRRALRGSSFTCVGGAAPHKASSEGMAFRLLRSQRPSRSGLGVFFPVGKGGAIDRRPMAGDTKGKDTPSREPHCGQRQVVCRPTLRQVTQVGSDAQAKLKPCLRNGNCRIGRPVAATMALITAGPTTQIVGSPTPPQKS